jgi:ectoine hydroxylase-related dioxygenase (phytanoyl-CoA dioxygenase family)
MLQMTDKHPVLAKLPNDSRVVGVVNSLMGDAWQFAESDASLFDCETHWHADFYGADLSVHHVKLSFYLDPLRADSGAIRVIPGTNDYTGSFARTLRGTFWEPGKISSIVGVDPRDVPSTALDSDPGDVIVWDFRTIHASYYGGMRRRLLSLNFREVPDRTDP